MKRWGRKRNGVVVEGVEVEGGWSEADEKRDIVNLILGRNTRVASWKKRISRGFCNTRVHQLAPHFCFLLPLRAPRHPGQHLRLPRAFGQLPRQTVASAASRSSQRRRRTNATPKRQPQFTRSAAQVLSYFAMRTRGRREATGTGEALRCAALRRHFALSLTSRSVPSMRKLHEYTCVSIIYTSNYTNIKYE